MMPQLIILNKQKKLLGFTLVELLIYMGLISILMVMITQLFGAIFDVKIESEANSAVDQDGRFILSRLIHDIERSSAIITPLNYGSSSGNLVLTISGAANTYSVSGGNLQLTNNSGTNSVNSSQTTVSNMTFQKIGDEAANETVKITFTVSSIAQRTAGSEVRTFQTTVGRR